MKGILAGLAFLLPDIIFILSSPLRFYFDLVTLFHTAGF